MKQTKFICKKQRLNACSVLLSRNKVYTVIHTHAHILSHTYASVKCYNISVNVVVYLLFVYFSFQNSL